MGHFESRVDEELIRDREVSAVEEDRLGHESIVEQLEHLIKSVPTPTNIALYGPWGSGKSGIANLLRERVEKLRGAKFARFDAFKYAENPLRRNFVAAVAGSLGINDKKFHDELYNGKVTNDFQLPFVGLCKLLAVFAGVAAGTVFVSVMIMAAVALFGDAPFKDVFKNNISTLLGATLVPASIMTVLFAIVGKVLVVERRSEKLASDEQFEAIFRQLISNARLEKLVIFVDELDRCSPDNVVATLDAVRTFLGVEKCIFIVASDQQVLEKALTKSVQQARPLDKVNPYYSAGSAYLDKVFQYHISVPSLLPHSVTRYALGLVGNRTGVWANINVAQIVSILVPSHVKSPRRVKNLLNSFALFYRLAESRRRAGFLQADLIARAEEMAKLVCLNVEFPLFARDLLVDHKLPEYVLALFELGNPGEYSESEDDTGESGFNTAINQYWREQKYVSHSVIVLAKEYAFSNASPAPLMVSGNADNSEINMRGEVERSQARQLIDYLSRTRLVATPQKDFIHLQSAGNLFGLSGEAAGELELHAQNGSWQKVVAIYEKLDATGRKGALQFLLQQGRVAIGLEQDNIVSSILSIVSDDQVDISAEADQLFDMAEITVSKSHGLLNASTMKGAWRLCILSGRAAAEGFGEKILCYEGLQTSIDLVVYILTHTSRAIEISPEKIADVFNYHLYSESPEILMDEIGAIGEERLAAVLSVILSRVSASLNKMAVDYKAAQDAASQANVEINSDAVDPSNTITALVGALLSSESQELREVLLSIILEADHEKFRAGLEAKLSTAGKFGANTNIRRILQAASLRSKIKPANWIDLIDKNCLLQANCSKEYSSLLSVLVKDADSMTEESRSAAFKAVLSLWDGLPSADQDAVAKSISEISLRVKVDDDVAKVEKSLAVLGVLVNAGVIAEKEFLSMILGVVISSLEEESPVREPNNVILNFVTTQAEWLLKQKNTLDLEGVLKEDVQSELIESLIDCKWMPDYSRKISLVRCLSLVSDSVLQNNLDNIPSYSDVSSLITAQGVDFLRVLPAWVSISHEPALSMLDPINNMIKHVAVSDLSLSLSRWIDRSPTDEKEVLFRKIVSDPNSAAIDSRLLAILGAKDFGDDVVCSSIIDRFKAAGTKQQKIEVLKLWRRAGAFGGDARKQLIEAIFIPCLQEGGAVSIEAIEEFAYLCTPIPKAIKQRLGDIVVSSAEKEGMEQKHVYDILRAASYRVKKRLFSKPTIDSE